MPRREAISLSKSLAACGVHLVVTSAPGPGATLPPKGQGVKYMTHPRQCEPETKIAQTHYLATKMKPQAMERKEMALTWSGPDDEPGGAAASTAARAPSSTALWWDPSRPGSRG